MKEEWKKFEDETLELLKLQGWIITSEILLEHKKVDIYAEKIGDFNKINKIGVECKYYNSPLNKSQINSIFSDYFPLCDKGIIDYVLIVTKNGVSPASLKYIKSNSYVRHITGVQLAESIIDFSNYLNGIKNVYFENQLNLLYTAQQIDNSDKLAEDFIIEWVENLDYNPIAVLGGYGLGKSTLTKRITHLLCEKHFEKKESRIPILIKLEDIATEQKLEGLLGSQFTSNSTIKNYNFQLFEKLNRLGKFVFLLDGFDEMKKTMSWESLKYNLDQLFRLISEKSKVILLGRPTAFYSNEEHNEALHGIRKVMNSDRKIPNAPDFTEIYLKPFKREQIKEFITKYISVKTDKKNVEIDEKLNSNIKNIKEYLDRIDSSKGKRLADLVGRPVQLKMLLEILPSYKGEITQLSVALLYSEFIDLIIRREQSKPSRENYSPYERRKFASSLAYWMWQNDHGSEIESTQIPDSIFAQFVLNKRNLKQVKRDLLVGSFLERKPPVGLYFPHRSFQEFLVAENIVNLIKEKSTEIGNCPFLTPEVRSFFLELIGKKEILSLRKMIEAEPDWFNTNCLEIFDLGCDFYNVKNTIHPKTDRYNESSEALSRRKILKRERKRNLLAQSILTFDDDSISKIKEIKESKGKSKKQHKLRGVTKKSKYKK